jgi:hypothetical protein
MIRDNERYRKIDKKMLQIQGGKYCQWIWKGSIISAHWYFNIFLLNYFDKKAVFKKA